MSNRGYSLSLRGKELREPVKDFLEKKFSEVPLDSVEDCFGFPNRPSRLYGGRAFYINSWAHRKRVPQVSEQDAEWMLSRGIRLKIPLTNLFVTREEYVADSGWLREIAYTRPLTLVVANPRLAKWIREDLGDSVRLEASVIRGASTASEARELLETVDVVVPSFEVHEDLVALAEFPRDSTRLFLNVSCERACPARICYAFFSRVNKNPKDVSSLGPSCSQTIESLASVTVRTGGITRYDEEAFKRMGFWRFKLLSEKKPGLGQAA